MFGTEADFAQVMAPIKGQRRLRIERPLGKPDEDRIGTSLVERHNGTIRQQIRRFARKTLAFSKNLRAAVALYVAWYDVVRPHRALHGMTRAMALGIEWH